MSWPVLASLGKEPTRSPPMAIELPDGRSESNEVLEALRRRAVHARELGYAVVDIAAILGVREETVSRWCVKYERGGEAALPGGPKKVFLIVDHLSVHEAAA